MSENLNENPNCNAVKEIDGEFSCGTPGAHEGYVHAESVNDVERALDSHKNFDGDLVHDCDGDVVQSILDTPDDRIQYAWGDGQRGVSTQPASFFLISEVSPASEEEIAEALQSIRSTF